MSELTIRAVHGIGDIRPGTDLAAAISAAAPWLADGDVLVVTSKIVSKAEGRLVPVPVDGPEREAARDAALAAETARPVARRGQTRIVQTHHGFVLASAGIDASNVDRDQLVLLPVDPDASARRLRATLRTRTGLEVAVVISDTMGRPWRNGLTDVALGAAGIEALLDYRGQTDAYGNQLQLTQMAVVDELSAAAELVKGKYDQVPVAVIRGLRMVGRPDGDGARVLVRDAALDLFSMGTAEARAAGLYEAATLRDATGFAASPVDAGVLAAAVALTGSAHLRVLDAGPRDKLTERLTGTPEVVLAVVTDQRQAAGAGADLHRLRAALAAHGLASAVLPTGTDTTVLSLAAEESAVAMLAVGYPPQEPTP